jgi:hypothetical protein
VSGVVNCDEVAMAGHDILLWEQQAADTLPAGDVEVIFVDGTPPVYTINVTWSEPGADPLSPPAYSIAIPVIPN